VRTTPAQNHSQSDITRKCRRTEGNAKSLKNNEQNKIKMIWARFKHIGNRIRTTSKISRNTIISAVYRVNKKMELLEQEWSEFLATDPEVPGSIPGHAIFSEK
jgi:hypothetical protein